jgi:hypothetical protein
MENKGSKIFVGLFIFITLSVWFYQLVIEEYLLKQDHRYTIGIILKITPNIDSGPDATYYFRFNGVYQEEFISINTRPFVQVGQRYYVKFYPHCLSISRIETDKPVPDVIKEAPPAGWEELPQ